MENSEDYSVHIKVRNGRIEKLMEIYGYKTVADLAKASGIRNTVIGKIINFKISAKIRNNDFRVNVKKLAKFFNVEPSDLFSDEQLDLIVEDNSRVVYLSSSEMNEFINIDSNKLKCLKSNEDDEKSFNKMLSVLTKQELNVISKRFGFEGDELTLKQISDDLNLSQERIRQIENKALRKMRNPRYNKEIHEIYLQLN